MAKQLRPSADARIDPASKQLMTAELLAEAQGRRVLTKPSRSPTLTIMPHLR